MKRITSIDFTRGIVMIIMVLDHVRDMIHVPSIVQQPTNLATTTPILFFTRVITHLCAPAFVFLAGTSAYISFRNKGDIAQSRKWLLKRGIWLVFLEFSLVNLALFFDLGFHTLIFEVIAAIGFGFIFLSLMMKLPSRTIGIIGLVILFCHDLLSLVPLGQGSMQAGIFSSLFSPGAFPVFSRGVFIMGYPPIPWLGIMLVGFAAGKLFELPDGMRKKIFLRIGLGALALFVALRFANVYGDPVAWSVQKNAMYTFLSFMNVTKYPPSLSFCLITLGIMFLLLAMTEGADGLVSRVVSVYGKVPLFYFLVHLYVIHMLLLIILFLQGFSWSEMSFASGTFGRPKAAPSGLALWAVYGIWVAVVAALYQPCRWFGRYKATHRAAWLKYI